MSSNQSLDTAPEHRPTSGPRGPRYGLMTLIWLTICIALLIGWFRERRLVQQLRAELEVQRARHTQGVHHLIEDFQREIEKRQPASSGDPYEP